VRPTGVVEQYVGSQFAMWTESDEILALSPRCVREAADGLEFVVKTAEHEAAECGGQNHC
jgi:hypothetical protein